MSWIRGLRFALVGVPLMGALARPVSAEDLPRPPFSPLPTECLAADAVAEATASLPNIANAMKLRNRIVVLAIGASAMRGKSFRRGDYFGLVEAFLERTFKGLDVVFVQRGISGELARDAAERIKLEVARAQPDVVFWQLGTADALAGIDPDTFAQGVKETVHWLRDHNVDPVLIGLHYSRVLAADPHYQAVRASLAAVGKDENVLRIGRYEVVETLSKLQKPDDFRLADEDLTEVGYNCTAEYLARALATGLYGREKPGLPPAKKLP